MTSGIYALVFAGTYVYIGKSINIENRWKQHWEKMSSGKAAKNVQDAFNRYGYPATKIVAECHPDHIDLLETITIRTNKHLPLLNSAGTAEISQVDADLLVKNGNLITKSTADHIREINNLRQIVEESNATIESYETKGITTPEKLAKEKIKSAIRINELESEIASATKAVLYWKAEAQKSWWQRLFS